MIDLTPRAIRKIEFTVPGPPNQKRSPSNMRFKRKDGTEIWRPVANKKNKPVEKNMQQWAIQAGWSGAPHTGPVILRCRYYFPIPKSAPQWQRNLLAAEEIYHTKKPDLDRLVNMVQDALTGVVWTDDSQVIAYNGSGKFYGARPRTEVTIWLCREQIPGSKKEYDKMMKETEA